MSIASTNASNGSGECARLLLIQKDALWRAALKNLMAGHPGVKVIGEAGRRNDALEVAVREQPDVALLDMGLTSPPALDLLPELIDAVPAMRVLMLTGREDPEVHQQAFREGAAGLVSTSVSPETLLKAIERVHAGEAWLDRWTTAQVLRGFSRAGMKPDPEEIKIASLTVREREVISLLGGGLKNSRIAAQLFISEVTVRHHMTAIYGKLEVSDRLELAIYAYRHGLATIPR